MKFFTHYWSNETWNTAPNLEGQLLAYVAGNMFSKRGVHAGDTIYVVTVIKGQLYLCGKMEVGRFCSRTEAAQALNYAPEDMWEAREYLVAVQATPMHFDRAIPAEVVRSLEFISDASKPVFSGLDHLDQQTMRGVREISPKSAAEFDLLLPPTQPTTAGFAEERNASWSIDEVNFIVCDHFEMLVKELDGRQYSKAEHRRLLQMKLRNRSEASIEYKHQNISAVLIDLGMPHIEGYKPATNYQQLLYDKVFELIEKDSDLRQRLTDAIADVPRAPELPDVQSVFVSPPKRTAQTSLRNPLGKKGRNPIDFAAIDAQNRALGERGEEFVFKVEKAKLVSLGREDLSLRIERTAQIHGPEAGYDIKSFSEDGSEIFIEVKTTNGNQNTPFLITANEVRASEEIGKSYRLYRVFDFSKQPKIYVLNGSIKDSCSLDPRVYSARPM